MRAAFAGRAYRYYIAACVRRVQKGETSEPRSEGLLRRLREWLVAHGDPVVELPVGKRTLAMPLSHELPLYAAVVPTYDRVLPFIAARIRRHTGSLVMIDVGANIGDTAALVSDEVPDARMLCIEGSPRYFALLQQNIRVLGIDATPVQVFCGDESGATHEIREHGGTGELALVTAGARPVETRTLDQVIAAQPAFARANLLKVDTDGFDAKVLRGSSAFVQQAKPVIFFEYAETLLRNAGDDPAAVFEDLAVRGYTNVELFNNQGVSLGQHQTTGGEAFTAASAAVGPGKADYLDVLAWTDSWSSTFAASQ